MGKEGQTDRQSLKKQSTCPSNSSLGQPTLTPGDKDYGLAFLSTLCTNTHREEQAQDSPRHRTHQAVLRGRLPGCEPCPP